jgi:hypothetical protein
MPIAMPASIPTGRTAALVHIINYPIMGFSLTFRRDLQPVGTPKLTHGPQPL